MAARGSATLLLYVDPAYAASNYAHPAPVAHAFAQVATFLSYQGPAYLSSTYAHPAPVAHAFPAATAIYYGPW